MPKIISNIRVAEDVFLMKLSGNYSGKMGQFYMLRAWGRYPLLSRPISIFDIQPNSISFLYRVFGQGTKLFSELGEGEQIKIEGPFGNGFPLPTSEKIALIGGGIGIAPLYYAVKECLRHNTVPHVYLGFNSETFMVEQFKALNIPVVTTVGGYVTSCVPFDQYKEIYACGPQVMMQHIHRACVMTKSKLYVSLEKEMACGLGACFVCSIPSCKGNKRVCKEGPVFLADEVFAHE